MADGRGEGTPPTDGSAGTTDLSWLSIVEHGTCAGCGLTASAVPLDELADRLSDEARRFADLLRSTPDESLRRRPDRSTWSALEYAVHTRDTLDVFTGRVRRMLVESEPDLGWWDHEAAIADGSANRSDPDETADGLMRAVTALTSLLDGADGHGLTNGWSRRGVRRGTEIFTVESTIRFALHELAHHLDDAESSIETTDRRPRNR